ncbi:sensor histidine kinase [Amycolatopsis pigmentata]|uniref:Sensor histidine kinase n=1 Tax=Amycolatopsis pigmentata TaxID=450801 RepID=A0ABW5G0N5_9PSEU
MNVAFRGGLLGETADARLSWWSASRSAYARDRVSHRWLVIAVVVLLPILMPAVRAVSQGEVRQVGIATLVLLIPFAFCYLIFPYVLFPARPLAVQLGFVLGMLALAWLLVTNGASVYVLTYAMTVAALGVPPGWFLVFDGLSICAAYAIVLTGGPLNGTVGDVGTVTGLTIALFFVGRLAHAVRHLRAAQEEIATLAVTTERERLARDLHDILGHSLTTITVKAGLARRVLESSSDVDRAITEIREVEQLSRSALSDVRATVSDYREVSLPAEVVGARAALRAAEIDADLPSAVDNVRPDLQQAFGYVLREAVTNVIRHSGAKQVRVRLGRTWIEITDDGEGTTATAGNGLRGLGERLAEIGGTLRAEPRENGGFRVRAEVTEKLEGAA